MALLDKLEFWIGADGSAAVQEFQRVGNAASKDLGKATSSTDIMSARFLMAGGLMVGAAGVLGRALWNTGAAASDLAESANQVQQVFGKAAPKVAEFAKAADSIGLSERAANDAATSFGLFLTNAGFSADAAADVSIEMTKLAADMASFKNTSPEEAVEAIGAAFRGETEGIRRYGVTINEVTLKQKAQELGLRQVNGQLDQNAKMTATHALILEQTASIQGDFARTSDGAANAQRVFAAQVENLTASVGKSFIPFMQSGLGVTNALVSGITELDAKTGHAIGTIGGIATVGLGGLGALSLLAGAAVKVGDGWDTLTTGIARAREGMNKALGAVSNLSISSTGLGLAMATVGSILAVGFALWQEHKARQDAVAASTKDYAEILTGADEALKDYQLGLKLSENVLDAMGDSLQGVDVDWKALSDTVTNNRQGINDTADAWRQAIDVGSSLKDSLREQADSGNTAAAQILALAEAAGLSDGEIGDLIESLSIEAESLSKSKAETADANDAKADFVDQTGAQIQALDDLTKKLKGMMDPLFGMRDAEDGLSKAQREVSDAATAQFFAQAALDDARRRGNPDDIAEAERKLEEATRGVTDANNGQIQAAYKMEQAERTLEKALLDGSTSTEQAKAKIDEWRASGYITAEQASTLRTRVDELARKYGELPPSVNTNVTVTGLGDAIMKAVALTDELNRIDGRNVRAAMSAMGFGGSAVGRYLSAGDVSWVGENGPELFVAQQSGFVKNNQSRAAKHAGRGGGSVVNNINVQSNADPHRIASEVAWVTRTSGR